MISLQVKTALATLTGNNKEVVNKLKLWRLEAKFSDEDALRDGRLQIAEPQKVEQIRIHKARSRKQTVFMDPNEKRQSL